MSATDELRRMLDERGVEWRPIAWNPKKETFYHTSDGVGFCADEYVDGVKIYTDAIIAPEQAIEATLGPGTCHIGRGISGLMHVTTGHCSECGAEVVKPARYCSNCGRKVES